MENTKFIAKPELFKFCEFKSETHHDLNMKERRELFVSFLFGMFCGLPIMLCFWKNYIDKKNTSIFNIGTFVQLFIITIFLSLFYG